MNADARRCVGEVETFRVKFDCHQTGSYLISYDYFSDRHKGNRLLAQCTRDGWRPLPDVYKRSALLHGELNF
jgi:hypothetical protein